MIMTPLSRHGLAAAGVLLTIPLIVACTDNAPDAGDPGPGADPRALTVQATDTECRLSATTAPSGNLTFSVTNGGTKVTEFYLLAGDGLRIIGEIENIGPGLSRDLVLRAGPGDYITACKPGMVGEGIRAPFAISDSGEDSANDRRPDAARASTADLVLPIDATGPPHARRASRRA